MSSNLTSNPWPMARLDSIADVIDPHPSHRAPTEDPAGVPFPGIGDIDEDGSINLESARRVVTSTIAEHRERYQIEKGDIGFGRVATVGKTIRFRSYPFDIALSPTLALLKPQTCISSFLFHCLKGPAVSDQITGLLTGTTRSSLGIELLRRLLIPLPDPNEQSRIAAVLDTVDEAIAKTEAVIAKLKQVRAGLLHDLLTRGLDENGQLRDPIAHPEQFQDSLLGRIPREWDIAKLVSRIALPEGQVDPRVPPYTEWILVAPDHIESATGRLLATQTAAEQEAISGKYVFETGDVVYSKIRPYLRKAILAGFQGLCSADMYPLRPKAGINSRFLLAVILGEPFSRFASAVSMRSGFPKINREELAQFVTAWPKTFEQNRIADVLKASDSEQLAVEKELAKLQQLKSGLMNDLLTGRVRVPE